MEDSGIDSDQKTAVKNELCPDIHGSPVFSTGIPSEKLHKKLVKHVQETKKARNQNSEKSDISTKKSLLSKNRVTTPAKYNPLSVDDSILVSWESESEDDFDIRPPLSREAAREIRQQLIKDGFNLELSPDDDEDDLDLIPPPKPDSFCGKRCCILS